jgi:F-type H+-transporting ATPase subunit epsilon
VSGNFTLRLLTPYRSFFEGEVESVIVPGQVGEFGVQPGHTKLVSILIPGLLRYVEGSATREVAIGGGFAEVHPDGVTVFADSVETPEEIDVDRAKAALERAQGKLADPGKLSALEVAHWELHLVRAANRLKAAKVVQKSS